MKNYFDAIPRDLLEKTIRVNTTHDVKTFFLMKKALETAMQFIHKDFYMACEQEAKDLTLINTLLSHSIEDTINDAEK